MMSKLDVDNLDIEFENESDEENFIKQSKKLNLDNSFNSALDRTN